MVQFPDHTQIANLPLIEELYQKYTANPDNVEPSWRHFFEGIDFAAFLQKKGQPAGSELSSSRISNLIQAYRRYGHLLAPINPIALEEIQAEELSLENLGFAESELSLSFPTLGFCKKAEAPLQEIIEALHNVYCSRIGFEYMDAGNLQMERWIQKRIEPDLCIAPSIEQKHNILECLNKSEVLETFLNTKYQGRTRFSLEGNETLIPMLAALISSGAEWGMEEFIMGIAHRGRLNVLVNILNKPMDVLFKEFEDTVPYLEGESGDVKYHKGYSADVTAPNGKKVHLELATNSSCLESVDGIVLGQTKARQILAQDTEKKRIGSILMHGDAALAGQGVVYETLQMMRSLGFTTGGTVHIAINNQIGYTTLPQEGRSTQYCTDIAKTFGCPVFHVNAEDPESCLFAAQLALELRLEFQCDVFIDLNGYRRLGHNEGDDPSYTQPREYALIRSKKSIRQLYIDHLLQEGLVEQKMVEVMEGEYKAMLTGSFAKGKLVEPMEPKVLFGKSWDNFVQPAHETLFTPVVTQISQEFIEEILGIYCKVPTDFHLHPKLIKWLEEKKGQIQGDIHTPKIDWGTAECLAFGSIVAQGKDVRLAGEDSIRGTFSQRHAGWYDQESGALYVPLAHLRPNQARFDVYNTILSEYGSLAFELGYSWAHPTALVLWEAQYGDFVIGAQIAVDHYLVAGEQRWHRYSSLVLLLPHDFVGGGPEHSSARMERFLQLAACNNMQIVYPSTPAQYFHVLRRQAVRTIKKPLILFIPKSLLRDAMSFSPLSGLTQGEFQECIDDPQPPAQCRRLFLCTGKIYYEILAGRKNYSDAAIIRIEQLYPLHMEKLRQILGRYKGIVEYCWIQEEPENMGAWESIRLSLYELAPKGVQLRYIGRPRSSAPATGSPKRHSEEQQAILNALRGNTP